MPKETNLQFKVGLFVMVGLVALIIFIFSLSDSTIFDDGKSVKVIFNFANGLKKSAPVRMAGVDEGIVKDIKLFVDQADQQTKVEVEFRIKRETRIPIDSIVIINQLGLLGEKYIEINPGKNTVEFYDTGSVMKGKDPISQEALSEKVMDVANRLESAVGGIDQIVSDEQNITSIRETLANISIMSGGLKDIVRNVNEGKGTVGRLFYDERLYSDLQGLTADLKANPWKLLYRPKAVSK